VTGETTLDGATTCNETFTVAGNNATSLTGTLGVTGETTLDGTLDITGNTTVGGTLDVTSDSTLIKLILTPAIQENSNELSNTNSILIIDSNKTNMTIPDGIDGQIINVINTTTGSIGFATGSSNLPTTGSIPEDSCVQLIFYGTSWYPITQLT
jgi:hypothetical protein